MVNELQSLLVKRSQIQGRMDHYLHATRDLQRYESCRNQYQKINSKILEHYKLVKK